MQDYSLTRQERYLIFLLRWWIFLFTLAAAAFAIFPGKVVDVLNAIGITFFHTASPALPVSIESFWLVLAVSLLVVLVLAAFKAQKDIVKNISYVQIIIISKLTSTVGYIIAYFSQTHEFAYLAGAAIDGSIFLLTLWLYRWAIISRYVK